MHYRYLNIYDIQCYDYKNKTWFQIYSRKYIVTFTLIDKNYIQIIMLYKFFAVYIRLKSTFISIPPRVQTRKKQKKKIKKTIVCLKNYQGF